MLPAWLLPCLFLLSPVLCKTKLIKTQAPTTPDPPLATPNATVQDQELDLPPPSLLRTLFDTTVAVVEAPWVDSEAGTFWKLSFHISNLITVLKLGRQNMDSKTTQVVLH